MVTREHYSVSASSASDTPAVRTDGLSKTYLSRFGRRKVEALRPTTLFVQRGEIYGILGPNGAGKTTLLKLLLGVARPTTGSATIFGEPIVNPKARARLGYLPENHRFPSYLTARQALSIYGRMSGLDKTTIDRRSRELLGRVELSAWAGSKISTYSKGMQQRLGIAQALLNDPVLLILDEPTDGVDPIGRRAIRDLLVDLRRRGTTILLNSHLLSEVEQVCNRVAILRRGSLIREGTVPELTTMGRTVRIGYQPAGGKPQSATHLPSDLDAHTAKKERDHLVITLEDASVEDINASIDDLRRKEAQILYVEPTRRSLEAGFLDVLANQED